MACLNADGTLTQVARAMLGAIERGTGDEAGLATATGLPVWRVRASLRETDAAGLIRAAQPPYTLTEKGAEVLALSRELDPTELDSE